MSFTSVANSSTTLWSYGKQSTEIVADPDFDDPTYWAINFTAVVEDSKLKMGNLGLVFPGLPKHYQKLNEEYAYEIRVTASTGTATDRVIRAGLTTIYDDAGVGVFKGTFTVTRITGSDQLYILSSGLTGDWEIDYISLRLFPSVEYTDVSANSTSWSTSSVSTTWSDVAENTTTWS